MNTDDVVPGCLPCEQQALPGLPPREDVLHTDHWRVALAFNSTLPGWLVLLPTRHLTSFTELAPDAAAELGGLVHRLATALETVTGCTKTYLMQFSEAEGFSHLHLHLVPRLPDHPTDALGPRVFTYLSEDREDWLPEAERDTLALELRAASVESQLPSGAPRDPSPPASRARQPRVLRWSTGIAVAVVVLLVLGVIASFVYPWLVLVGALG